jgi:hypothetical protein
MRFTRTAIGITSAVLLTGAPAFGGQHGHASTPQPNAHAAARTSTSTRTPTPTTNPIATKIQANARLSSKVSAMLPIDPHTGKTMTLNTASMGFKNQGQFIAALHVSRNLGVSFVSLKNAMVTKQSTASGTTMTQTGSLGHAIQTVKHTSSATATTQATRAEQEADSDLKASTTTTKTPGTTKAPGDQ